MKTHLQRLIATFTTTALLFTGAALGQTPDPRSENAAPTTAASKMKAIVYHDYGPPEVLQLEEIDKPVPNDNQVLVKIRAVSINPYDWHFMEGSPYIARVLGFGPLKPKTPRLGVDFSGTVETVSKDATEFKSGDEVFGGKGGAWAEYMVIAEKFLAKKTSDTHLRAGGIGPDRWAHRAAGSSRQGKGAARPKVLIDGSSGGVEHVPRATSQNISARM